MPKIRCFIGVFVPENIKLDVARMQNSISALPASCKMVEPENLHINLSFLGNVEQSDVSSISSKLDEICSKYNSFEVEIVKIKLIPNKNYIRVVVLEALNESGDLEKISSEIKEKVGGSVKPPHITLCRVRRVLEKNKFVGGLENLKFEGETKFIVNSISLIKSELTKKGPIYTVLKDFRLKT